MMNESFVPLSSGYSFQLVFLFFVLGSLIGTYWEELLFLIQHHRYESRTGTVIGPFSPIYGVGVCIFAALLGYGNYERPIWLTYLFSCLIGGGTEFCLSLVAEYVFHEKIWDYHGRFLNILGRTTVPFMLGWGLGGLALMRLVYPLLDSLLQRIPYSVGQPIFIVLLVFMLIVLFLTYGSLGRQALRASGKPPFTPFGRLFDRLYPDEWLKKRFPAITLSESEKQKP